VLIPALSNRFSLRNPTVKSEYRRFAVQSIPETPLLWLAHTLSVLIFKTVDFQKHKTHHPPPESRSCVPPGTCRGSCPGGLLRYQPAWFSGDTFQLHWAMSFEGYVVVFWPLNAYKWHGCCKNLILRGLQAGFPCEQERTQKDCALSWPRLGSELRLLLMTCGGLQKPHFLCLRRQWCFRDPVS